MFRRVSAFIESNRFFCESNSNDSDIFVDPEIVNGVDEVEAGLVVTGTTVTAVGTVPPKFNFVAGNIEVAGIVACVTPDGIVATCEFGSEPVCTDTRAGKLTL